MKRNPHFFALLIISSCFAACKKVEPQDRLKIIKEDVYTPPGYNGAVYHKKTTVATFNGMLPYNLAINDIVIDSTNRSNAFIIGTFLGTGNVSSPGVIYFNSTSNSFSQYGSYFDLSTNVKTLYQAPDGKHYLGGRLSEVANSTNYTCYIGSKATTKSKLTPLAAVNNNVNSIKAEPQGGFYFSGDFDQLNSASCAPVLYYNLASVSSFGLPAGTSAPYTRCFSKFKAGMYLSGYGVGGNFAYCNSNSSSWSFYVSDGLNTQLEKMLMFKNKLYGVGYNLYSNAIASRSLTPVVEFDGVNSWLPVGVNSPPPGCWDIDVYNNTLYVCGYGFIYYLDNADNTWKSALDGSISPGTLTKIKFINGKLYAVEDNYTLLLFEH